MCHVHKLRKAKCDCPVPFELFPLPIELVQRKHWARIINRRDMKSCSPKLFCPPVVIPTTKDRNCVCSKHFVEGRPTEFYPYPTLDLGYGKKDLEKFVYDTKKKEPTPIIVVKALLTRASSIDTTENLFVDSEESPSTNDESEINEANSANLAIIADVSETLQTRETSSVVTTTVDVSLAEAQRQSRKYVKTLTPVRFEPKRKKPSISDNVSCFKLDWGDTIFVCTSCQKVFSTVELLTRHVEGTHPGLTDDSHPCLTCNTTWKTKDALLNHQRDVHEFYKVFKCLTCDDKFSGNVDLRHHYENAHGGHMCRYCNKIVGSSRYLRDHMDTVHNLNPNVSLCERCGKSFKHRYALRAHMLKHAGKTWDCRHCGSKFSASEKRNCHERIHTGEKPYVCEHCGRGFRASMNLKLHIRTHTGEKPYKCDMCGAGFAQRSGMTSHKARCSGLVKSSKSQRKPRRTVNQ